MRILFVSALLAAAFFAQPAAARSGSGPWCAIVNTGTGNVQEECYYGTAEECRQNVLAGNRGSCSQNPEWAYNQRDKRKPRVVRDY
jgi:hypothetical protein